MTAHGPIRVLVVDDHHLIREGIAALVASQGDIEIVGEAADGNQAVAQFEALRPDVMLLDLQMPGMGGLEALADIKSRHPQARIVILTTYDGDHLASRALAAGAQAYILKSSVRRELLDTIRAVFRGQKHVQADVAAKLSDHAGEDVLTTRELAVLSLIAEGNTNKAIGERLSITEETVKGYVKSILAKLHAKDRTHAVTLGIKRGIIEL
ncbi:response regulator transcription factor [Rhizobiaceae bacterium n13]|uniref:Response regulator transcription factor n=1 Tax=Ferirhizobium litorale TaxID=2927786 RepID=A0AAE3QFS8_9HYPH|nr:response regulator transcription factor [Fererhizobium litorale]MDI7862342.1 response regulator transcription factor [Fererhizobium litorale]MDI7922384.1 response regulator transcription factor [Fererhizobium litorale]